MKNKLTPVSGRILIELIKFGGNISRERLTDLTNVYYSNAMKRSLYNITLQKRLYENYY